MFPPSGLGTRLRHLLDLLDGDVARAYAEADLDYRPRFTPVLRALRDLGPSSITEIAAYARVTHSAISQTVAAMRGRRLIRVVAGADARSKRIALSALGARLLPTVEAHWEATAAAAATLDAELERPLLESVEEAIAALEHRSFYDRIAAQRQHRAATPADRT